MPFGLRTRVHGKGNHALDGVQIPLGRCNFWRKRAPNVIVQGLSAVSCAKTDEPIDLPFWLWTRVSRRKHKFNRISPAGRLPMCPRCPVMGGTFFETCRYIWNLTLAADWVRTRLVSASKLNSSYACHSRTFSFPPLQNIMCHKDVWGDIN